MRVDNSFQDIDATFAFAGLYGRYDWGNRFVQFKLIGGHSANDSHRIAALTPGGPRYADANYGGWFVMPEADIGTHFALSDIYVLTRAVRLRYLAGLYDGYTETGSAAGMTVGSRTAQFIEERGELALTRTEGFGTGEALQTAVRIGIIGSERIGGGSIDARLLGTAILIPVPERPSTIGGYAGARVTLRSANRLSYFADLEAEMTSARSTAITASGGVSMPF